MGGESVGAEISWLDVVKKAASVEHDIEQDDSSFYSSNVEPSWITFLNDTKDHNDVPSGSSNRQDARFLVREDIVQINETYASSSKNEELLLIKELNELKRSKTLSKEEFLGLLGPYLLSLKASAGAVSAVGKSAELPGNGVINRRDEKSTLSLLKKHARHLGQRLVSMILKFSISLKFWAPVQILLLRKVVVSNTCLSLVQSLVDEEQVLSLCLYIANVPDLAPQDLYLMLTFFIDFIEKPSKAFQLVRRDWKRVAIAEIAKAGKIKGAGGAATAKDVRFHNLEKLVHGQDDSVSSAVGVAMAVDGFSAPELCIHYLVASGQDEAVLSSVVSQLSTFQVLKLVQYISRWIGRYSSHLGNFPEPKNSRVPSLAQILSWAGVVFEGHFTKFVLSTEFHSEIRSMRTLVQSLIALGVSISPLGGITEHLRSHSLLPSGKDHAGSNPGYVIELLDLS